MPVSQQGRAVGADQESVQFQGSVPGIDVGVNLAFTASFVDSSSQGINPASNDFGDLP
jgi:hypothetical protein